MRTNRIHYVLQGLVALACLLLALRGWREALEPRGTDFTIYWHAGRAVLAGRDPMAVADWIYLPFCAVLIAPVAALPYAAAAGVWALGSCAAALWCMRRARELVQHVVGGPERPWLRWLPGLCVLRLIDSNLSYGQINLFVLVLLLEGAMAWSRARYRACGLWYGLAVAVKVLPGFLFVLLFLRRRWNALGVAVVTSVALVTLAPIPALGWEGSWSSLGTWWSEVAGPYRAGGEELIEAREYVAGQSLTAAVYRLLTPTPASLGGRGPSVNVLDLDPALVQRILQGLQLALVALFVLTVLRRKSAEGSRGWLAEVSLAMGVALLLGPLVHKAHMVWMLLPYTLLWTGPAPGLSKSARIATTSAFALSVVLIGATTPALIGRAAATWVQERNGSCLALLALVAALTIERWAARPMNPEAKDSEAQDSEAEHDELAS